MSQINVGTAANDHSGDPLRTAFQKLNLSMRDCYNVQSYGALPNGADCSTGVNAATAAARTAGGGVVFFPPGQYWFYSSPAILTDTTLDVMWLGCGRNATLLVQGAAGVTIVNLGTGAARFALRDMWIGAFSNFATGGGLNATATGYPSTSISELALENVTFQNLANPIYLDNVSQSNFRNVRYLQTRAGATIGDAVYMIRCQALIWDNSLIFTTTGTLPRDAMRIDSDCDTILNWKSEHVLLGNGASTAGFRVMDSVGSGTHPPRIIRFTDCLAENGQVGYQIDAARDCRMEGCEAANHNTYGFYITGGNSVSVVNSLSFLNQQHGIYVPTAGNGTLLEGNTCSNNSQQTNNTYDGIAVAASDVRILNNRSGDILFTLTNKQRFGLNLVAGSDFLTVGGNRLETNLGSGFEAYVTNQSTGSNNQFTGSLYLATAEGVLVAGLDARIAATIYSTTTLTAPRLVGAVFNPFRGQRLTFTFVQGGAGGFAVTWNVIYKTSWSDTGNTTGKRSSISYVYDGTNWNQDGAQTPYV